MSKDKKKSWFKRHQIIIGILSLFFLFFVINNISFISGSPISPEPICVKQTCPEGDLSKCDCSEYSDGSRPPISSMTETNTGTTVSTTGEIISLEPEPQPNEKTQAEIECLKKGCFLNNVCFPFGFVNNGTYCSEKGKFITRGIYRPAFVNQSETGNSCIQGYECKTGICSNGLCTDLTFIANEIASLKSNLTTLSQENAKLKSNLENLNDSVSETKQATEDNNSLIQKIADFLKTWFGFS